MKKTKAADFQSIKLGEYKVTYLPDGELLTLPDLSYHGSTADDWNKFEPDIKGRKKRKGDYVGDLFEGAEVFKKP